MLRRNELPLQQFTWIPVRFRDPWCDELEARVYWFGSSYMKYGQLSLTKP